MILYVFIGVFMSDEKVVVGDFRLKKFSLSEKLGLENGFLVQKKDLSTVRKIEQTCRVAKGENLVLYLPFNDEQDSFFAGLFNPREIKYFLNIEKYIKAVYNKNLFVYGGYSISSVAKASEIFYNLAKNINELKINDRHLSPLEKCLLIHEISSNMTYKIEKNPVASKSIYGALLSGHADCKGCSLFMTELLKLCSIPATRVSFIVPENGNFSYENSFHSACKVLIQDPYYNFKGIYICDPTFDMCNEKNSCKFEYLAISKREYIEKSGGEEDISNDKNAMFNTYKKITKRRLYGANAYEQLEKLEERPDEISDDILHSAWLSVLMAKGKTKNEAEIEVSKRIHDFSLLLT